MLFEGFIPRKNKFSLIFNNTELVYDPNNKKNNCKFNCIAVVFTRARQSIHII